MKLTASVVTLAMLSLAGPALAGAQDIPQKNPFEGDPAAIKGGMGMFRVRCADCHGMDARGIRAPDLSQVWAIGRTDDGLFRTVRHGIPGTEMPAQGIRTADADIWKILAYLRTLAAPAPTDPVTGNAANGERLFRVHCASCHRADGRGGRLGPDLSRVGVSRTRALLTRQIRGAVESIRPGYEPVMLTTPDGRQIHGVKKNEDMFSVQIMDTRERLQGYLREDMREVTDEKKSLMQPYDIDRLAQSDLDDLLAYLSTLKGADTTAPLANRQ